MSLTPSEIKELKVLCLKFRNGIIGKRKSAGTCFMVSAPLQGYLRFALGYDFKLIQVDFPHTDHCYLQIDENTILDPTADQFNDNGKIKLPKIYIGSLPTIYTQWIEEYKKLKLS